MSIHDVLVGYAIGSGTGVVITVISNYLYHKMKDWRFRGGRHSTR